MNTKKIYLAGGMSKFGKNNYDESDKWRKHCKEILNNRTYKYNLDIVNPNDYFNFKGVTYKSQREVMEFDLNKVRNSDLIIVNFNDPQSLGTMAELAIAYEKRIPIIGLNEDRNELHPWQIEMCSRIFDTMGEMLMYVKDYYLT